MKQLVVLFLLFVPGLSLSATSDFGRTLYVGMWGGDVRALQEFLNTDIETRVAAMGAGSLGNETDYFGVATKRALIKFQEKYRNEVLIPVGLMAGTGIFGVKTREKVNALVVRTQASITPLQEIPKPTVEQGKVYLMMVAPLSGKPGALVSLAGSGFTATDNTIFFGPDHAVVNASSINGQSITFKVPSIPKGLYSVYVRNAKGESNKEQWFIVIDGGSPAPTIESVAPFTVSRGETVTIKGTGFVPGKNTVVASGIGVFSNIQSKDGVSLSFTISKNTFPVAFSPSIQKPSFPITVHVLNENGVSKMAKFMLSL